MPFVPACKKSDVPPGGGKCVVVKGQRIAVFNWGDRFLATDDACTHEDQSLADGTLTEVDGHPRVECPLHGSQFDLETGAARNLPAVLPLRTYPVRINEDRIEVEV